jgi:hypothetical protein
MAATAPLFTGLRGRRILGSSHSPGPMPQGVSYVQVSGLGAYIRNIIPDDVGIIRLEHLALSGWGYADFHFLCSRAHTFASKNNLVPP